MRMAQDKVPTDTSKYRKATEETTRLNSNMSMKKWSITKDKSNTDTAY